MKEKFVSLRLKILLCFSVLLLFIILLAAIFLPNYIQRFFIRTRVDDVEQIRTVVAEQLSAADFRSSSETGRLLEATARSTGTCIWIALDEEGKVSVYSFGTTADSNESHLESELTAEESELVLSVLHGQSSGEFSNAFNRVFNGSTYSVGYQQNCKTQKRIPLPGGASATVPSVSEAAVFVHISMSDIETAANTILILVFAIIAVLSLASWFMVFFLTNNIIAPVRNLQEAAVAITRGDFSHHIENKQNDEIGQLTDSFNRMTEELKEADALQSDFIANISHDFRSPLTSIKGYIEAMMDGTIPEEAYPRYMGIVLDETNRLTKLANNVLDLTKMENGQITLNRCEFDINETIIRLALGFEQRIKDRKINIEFQFLQEKLYVNADEALIERVLYNLIDNALKFTREGDTISVETSIINKKASISVADSGIGISEESLPHIFERFHKGDRSRGRDKAGTGLGLTIAKQIMLTHGEDLTVYSKLGEGTCFSFTLPAVSAKNNAAKGLKHES